MNRIAWRDVVPDNFAISCFPIQPVLESAQIHHLLGQSFHAFGSRRLKCLHRCRVCRSTPASWVCHMVNGRFTDVWLAAYSPDTRARNKAFRSFESVRSLKYLVRVECIEKRPSFSGTSLEWRLSCQFWVKNVICKVASQSRVQLGSLLGLSI